MQGDLEDHHAEKANDSQAMPDEPDGLGSDDKIADKAKI